MKKRVKVLSLTMAMAIFLLSGCGKAAETPTSDTTVIVESQSTEKGPEETEISVETFQYTESAMNGALTIPWTLTLQEDGTYILEEENPMAGVIEHTGTYEADGDLITTSAFDEKPEMIASFLNEDTSCVWKVDRTTRMAEPITNSAPDAMAKDMEMKGKPEAENTSVEKIAYASQSDSQTLTIHKPEGKGTFPVIILVHGGGFLFGDSEMSLIQPVIEKGVEKGYAVVSVDYRKSSEAVFPAALADVKAAVRYVRANAEQYGFDTENIIIWGESAGAYLSLMTALTPDVEELNGDVTDNAEYSSEVRILIDFYGPVEFAKMDEEYALLGIDGTTYSSADSFESKFLGQALEEDLTETYKTYWETYVDQLPEDFELDAWIQVGDVDQKVPYTQSVHFAERLATVIGEENVTSEVVAGADHEDAAFYADDNLNAIFAFIESTQN